MPSMPTVRWRLQTCCGLRVYCGRASEAAEPSRRTRQRAVDRRNHIGYSISRNERAESGPFLLAEQHLIEHVEPVERHARLAVLGFDLAAFVEKRLAPADLVNHLLYRFRGGLRRQLRQRIAQIRKGGALGRGRGAEFFRRRDKVAIV